MNLISSITNWSILFDNFRLNINMEKVVVIQTLSRFSIGAYEVKADYSSGFLQDQRTDRFLLKNSDIISYHVAVS